MDDYIWRAHAASKGRAQWLEYFNIWIRSNAQTFINRPHINEMTEYNFCYLKVIIRE